MKTIIEHLDSARSNIRGEEELLRRIISQIPEHNKPRRLISPYVTYILSTTVSVYALFIIGLPFYNNYALYRVDNAIDKEIEALDKEAELFENNIDLLNVEEDLVL